MGQFSVEVHALRYLILSFHPRHELFLNEDDTCQIIVYVSRDSHVLFWKHSLESDCLKGLSQSLFILIYKCPYIVRMDCKKGRVGRGLNIYYFREEASCTPWDHTAGHCSCYVEETSRRLYINVFPFRDTGKCPARDTDIPRNAKKQYVAHCVWPIEKVWFQLPTWATFCVPYA